VTAAQGIVDGGLGGISGPDGSGSIEVRGQAYVGRDRGGTDGSRSKRERAESLACVDGAIDGGVSEDVLTARGFEQIVGADFEISGSGVALHTIFLDDEEPIPLDGDIGGDPGRSHITLRKVGWLGCDRDSRALLNGIAGAIRAEVLVEQVGELDVLVLITDSVQVGEIVGGG